MGYGIRLGKGDSYFELNKERSDKDGILIILALLRI